MERKDPSEETKSLPSRARVLRSPYESGDGDPVRGEGVLREDRGEGRGAATHARKIAQDVAVVRRDGEVAAVELPGRQSGPGAVDLTAAESASRVRDLLSCVSG